MYKFSIAVGLLAGCVGGDFGSVEQKIDADACPAGVPAALAPAADQDLAFALDAVGTQNYHCSDLGTWIFDAPAADLFQIDHDDHVTGTHYIGPTWEWIDGSTFVGAKVAGVTVDTTAIPWLLLKLKSHNDVVGKMTDVTSVQRLSTTAGLALGACTAPATTEVPYTARYFFYETKADNSTNTRCGAL